MKSSEPVDVVLIGGGIMSATLGVFLTHLQPSWNVRVCERLGDVAQESSDPWNNAGTGHAGLCELNYTPESADGSIDPAKAVAINEQFQMSRQLWAHLVEEGELTQPSSFINPVPHMTFVRGETNCEYLRKRYEVLRNQPLFHGLEFSDDPKKIEQWAPLFACSQVGKQKIAATRIESGTDVDFGALTRALFDVLKKRGVSVHVNEEVRSLRRGNDGLWDVTVRNVLERTVSVVRPRFVFVGAGGSALNLLQKSGIPEIRGFGGFPISGQFLRTTKPEIVSKHEAKVYGKASVGAPPMSVPHLDTRVVNGQKSLLFGPFAGFSPKFLKTGSVTDLPFSVRPHNIKPMLTVALHNGSLMKYLLTEVLASRAKKMASLREFVPAAVQEDWELITAGQRVQVMKKDPLRGGVLQFGTEIVSGEDGTIAGLLGASPGASTAVSIMLTVLARCFPDRIAEWEPKIKAMVPSYATMLSDDPRRAAESLAATAETLGLMNP